MLTWKGTGKWLMAFQEWEGKLANLSNQLSELCSQYWMHFFCDMLGGDDRLKPTRRLLRELLPCKAFKSYCLKSCNCAGKAGSHLYLYEIRSVLHGQKPLSQSLTKYNFLKLHQLEQRSRHSIVSTHFQALIRCVALQSSD